MAGCAQEVVCRRAWQLVWVLLPWLKLVACAATTQAARGSVVREATALEEQRAALAALLSQLEQREEALGQVGHWVLGGVLPSPGLPGAQRQPAAAPVPAAAAHHARPVRPCLRLHRPRRSWTRSGWSCSSSRRSCRGAQRHSQQQPRRAPHRWDGHAFGHGRAQGVGVPGAQRRAAAEHPRTRWYPQAAWLEAGKEAAKRSEAQAAELAAREARLAAQQQVRCHPSLRGCVSAQAGGSGMVVCACPTFVLLPRPTCWRPHHQSLAEEGARLSVLQEQLAAQQQQLAVAALRASNGSPSAAAAVAARAASLAARETQLLQQQQELTDRERLLAQVRSSERMEMLPVRAPQTVACSLAASAAPPHLRVRIAVSARPRRVMAAAHHGAAGGAQHRGCER